MCTRNSSFCETGACELEQVRARAYEFVNVHVGPCLNYHKVNHKGCVDWVLLHVCCILSQNGSLKLK